MTKAPDMKIVRARMDLAVNGEKRHHSRAAEDLSFLTVDQWPEEERLARDLEGRPVLTFNLCIQAVERVKAQIRDMNPAVRVKAADSAAHPEIAKIIEGLVRSIENVSRATAIYEAAGESAAACSMGYFRLRTDYIPGDTFDQEILIERIHSPFASFPDPAAKEPTRSDARYWFLIEEMGLDDFKAAYPKARVDDFTAEHRPTDYQGWVNWQKGDRVVIAEYFWIEDEEYEIALLPTGEVMRKEDLPPGFKPAKVRKVKRPRVKWLKCSGAEILEGPKDVPGQFIPVIAVTGAEYHLGEETYRASVIRFAKDAQVAYNITRTSAIEVVLTQPKAPWLVTAEQVAGLEEFWNDAHKSNRPYLPYNQVDGAAMPQRSAPPMASQGLMAEAQLAAEDVKRTTGIYDASLGQRSNETSGRAILARQSESEAGTSIYADNLVKAVEHCGRVIVSMVPEVYDAKRIVRILGQDGKEDTVIINDLIIQDGQPRPVNDLTLGRYEVAISVGPSYDTKRQEAAEILVELSRSVPQIGMVGSDILVRALDIPNGDVLADRLKKSLPPGVAEQDKDPSPEEQQAMQAAAQQGQQQAQMQEAGFQAEIRLKTAQADKAQAEAMKAQAEAQITQIEAAKMSGQIAADMESVAQHAVLGAVLSQE